MPKRDKWLEERKTGIGSSDIAAIAGLSKWATPFDVFCQKKGLVEVAETTPMRRGRFLEDGVADWYQDDTGNKIEKHPQDVVLRHPDHEFVIGTPDFLGVDNKDLLVEIKTVGLSQARLWGEQQTDEIPYNYLCQVQWQLGITGRHRGDTAALVGGEDLRVYVVEFDRDLFDSLVEVANEFWYNHIVPNIPPELDGSASAKALIADKFPQAESKEYVTATPEIDALAAELSEVSDEIKVLTQKKAALQNKVKTFIGDAGGVGGHWGHISWGNVRGAPRNADVIKALADLYEIDPDVIAEVTEQNRGKPYRRFTLAMKG